MTMAHVEMPVPVNNSPIQDYSHPDDHISPTYEKADCFFGRKLVMDGVFLVCFKVLSRNLKLNHLDRAATESSGTAGGQAKPVVRSERDRPGVRNAVPNDERVPSSIGRAANPNKSEIPERAADRSRRGKTQRVSKEWGRHFSPNLLQSQGQSNQAPTCILISDSFWGLEKHLA